MKKSSLPGWALLALIALPSFSDATTLTVDLNGGGDYRDIQSAIDAAADGDTVLVMPGQYLITQWITIPGSRAVRVISKAGPEETMIKLFQDPGNPTVANVVVFYGDSEAPTPWNPGGSEIDGFTLTGGRFRGVRCVNPSEPWEPGMKMRCSIKNCRITNNLGGGVFAGQYTFVWLINCRIYNNNYARYGGGVHSDTDAEVWLHNCTITENEASIGGGLYFAENSSNKVMNCQIGLNKALCPGRADPGITGGGGISCDFRAGLWVENCKIFQNEASHGGGIACSSFARFFNCFITENRAIDSCEHAYYTYRGVGGAVHGIGTFVNCTIVGNHAAKMGGAVESRLGDPSDQREKNASLVNCIVWNNTAGTYPETSNTVWGTVDHCLTDQDPQFVAPGLYRIRATSPAIDAGTAEGMHQGDIPGHDIDGRMRSCGQAVDIGAYEYCEGSTFAVRPYGILSDIQSAIDTATDDDTVLVMPGEYELREPLDFNRLHDPDNPFSVPKNIHVKSHSGPDRTLIRMSEFPFDSHRASVVVFENGEDERSVLEGFTLTGGAGIGFEPPPGESVIIRLGGGIYCEGASPTIRRCMITENNTAGPASKGGGILCWEGSPSLINCLIAKNTAGGNGSAIYATGSADMPVSLNVTSCTITGNTLPPGLQTTVLSCGGNASINLKNGIVWGNTPNVLCAEIDHCIADQDPLFVDPENGDYHLLPGSPAIGAGTWEGAPDLDIEGRSRTEACREPFVDARISIGAYEYSDCESVDNISTGYDWRQELIEGTKDWNYLVEGTRPFTGGVIQGFPIPPWTGNDERSLWISYTPTSIAPPGISIYEIRKWLAEEQAPRSFFIRGKWAADDSLIDVVINGTSLGALEGGFAAFQSFPPYFGLRLFEAGENTIEFHVENSASSPNNPTGLRVEAWVVRAAPGGSLPGGYNPAGWIRSDGWNLLFPILNPHRCGGGGITTMLRNWIPPHEITGENPRAGDLWDDIDWAASPGEGFDFGGVFAAATWTSVGLLESEFPDASPFPVGDAVLFDTNNDMNPLGLIQHINFNIIDPNPGFGWTRLPRNAVMALGTTYVENISGAPLEVELCFSSDDSGQVWVNNVLAINVSVCRFLPDGCTERVAAILPEGISKITCAAWQGVSAWGWRLGIFHGGSLLTDGNGLVEFLGPGGEGVSGQEQYQAERSVVDGSGACDDEIKVQLTGSGPGAGADMLEITEEILAADPGAITAVGSFQDEELLYPARPAFEGIPPGERDPVGSFDDHRVVGRLPCGRSNTTFTTPLYISSSRTGGDIGGSGDTFEFSYRRVSGDFDVSIAIVERRHSSGSGRGGTFGLMARWDLSSTARFTMIADSLPSPLDGASLLGRAIHNLPGGTYEDVAGNDPRNPGQKWHPDFMRLTRRGDAITGWISDNPAVVDNPRSDALWTRIGRVDNHGPSAPEALFVGFANSEHASGGCDAQIITFALGDWHITPPAGDAPIGKSLTWNGISRASLSSTGLSYKIRYEPGGITNNGNEIVTLTGVVVGEAITSGHSGAFFIDHLGPSGPQAGACSGFEEHHDIGLPPAPGETRYNAAAGRYRIQGSGVDIGNGGDQLHHAFSEVTGNFQATARVVEVRNPPNERWGRYGIAARYGCETNSKYSMATFTYRGEDPEVGGVHEIPGQDSHRHQSRRDHLVNATTRDQQVLPAIPFGPNVGMDPENLGWVRLTRRGNYFYSEFAPDLGGEPGPWVVAGGDTHMAAPASLLVGLFSSAHASAGANTLDVTFDDWCVTTPEFAAWSGKREWEIFAHSFPGSGAINDAGIETADNGAFTPQRVNGRLRLADDAVGFAASAAYFDFNGRKLGDEPWVAAYSVFYSGTRNGVEPADGICFVAHEGSWPTGGAFLGDPGSGLGYNLGDHNEVPNRRTKSFAVELDTWIGGISDNDPPGGHGSNSGVVDRYHLGLDFNMDVQSAQNHVEYSAILDLPSIFNSDPERGLRLEVHYQPLGESTSGLRVFAAECDGANKVIGASRKVLDAIGPKLDGDIVLGFAAATGGRTANFDVDDFRVWLATAPPKQARFDLGYAGPCGATRRGGTESRHVETIDCTLTTSGNESGIGAQSWSISMASSGVEITAITTAGTVADEHTNPPGLRDKGFEESEITTGPGNEGAVSTVVLSRTEPITLPPEGEVTIARIEVEGTYPMPGQTTAARVFYIDGRRGSDQPVDNVITQQGLSAIPALGECSFTLGAAEVNWVTYDANDDGKMDISDAVAHMSFLFIGGNSPVCAAPMDFNGDGRRDLSDPIGELGFLFLGGPPPAAGLGCQSYPGCGASMHCP